MRFYLEDSGDFSGSDPDEVAPREWPIAAIAMAVQGSVLENFCPTKTQL